MHEQSPGPDSSAEPRHNPCLVVAQGAAVLWSRHALPTDIPRRTFLTVVGSLPFVKRASGAERESSIAMAADAPAVIESAWAPRDFELNRRSRQPAVARGPARHRQP